MSYADKIQIKLFQLGGFGNPSIAQCLADCKELGIDIIDENGNMRPVADICADMSEKLKKLSG